MFNDGDIVKLGNIEYIYENIDGMDCLKHFNIKYKTWIILICLYKKRGYLVLVFWYML